ncbi:uncharacterized protein LOC115890780 [Sitophilus oryzae]|uniref:Uncharacterized protein LOC115890780 n=1 Tax=Sitophilus oryzae TaxID=7048 RepID=A0A6J2YUM2_SITOR|nr:uncharacterized protein LOC115890780 [Sitophilus oryzae]
MLKNIVVLCMTIVSAKAQRPYDDAWHRRWFPHYPTDIDTNPVVSDGKNLNDAHHGIAMGVIDSSCDDGKGNIQIDWLNNEENYTCLENRRLYQPNPSVHPIDSVEHIPEAYSAQHRCMNESISYNEIIPTFGTHRPLWAAYGEYTFLPKQRWLHNLEHGAITMLYHPCANKNEVKLLASLVKSCLYRHVITPYNLLSSTRPLALVSWGHRLEMSEVAPVVVIDFIKKHALKGPEKTHRNGQYSHGLKEGAQPVSDMDDTVLCPNVAGEGIEMK